MILRPSRPEDAPQLVALVKQTYVHPPYNHYLDPALWIRFMHHHASVVVEDKNRVVAHGGLEDKITYGVLSRSFVHKEYRQRDIYKKLYEARIAQAKSRNLPYLESHASTQHDVVQQFLLSRHFAPVGIELLEINDIDGVGQRGSLVRLRKALSGQEVTPAAIPQHRLGLVPINYNPINQTWQYEELPKQMDWSLLTLHPLVVEKLHLGGISGDC